MFKDFFFFTPLLIPHDSQSRQPTQVSRSFSLSEKTWSSSAIKKHFQEIFAKDFLIAIKMEILFMVA